MLNIKHTICPSCSVGCGISIVSDDDTILGTYPYKRHPVNEGKNCLNGRSCFENYANFEDLYPGVIKNNKIEEYELDDIIKNISTEIKNGVPEEFGILASGNLTNEELELIKNITDQYDNSLALYENNFINFAEVANYDDINEAKTIITIGDIFNENPLIGRRIVIALEKGATLYSADDKEKSVTSINSNKYIKFDSISEFLDNVDNEIIKALDENAIIIFNKVSSKEDCDKLINLSSESNSKLLPILKNCNSKGALNIIDSSSIEEIHEFLSKLNVLLVMGDNPLDYLKIEDFKNIKTIITVSNYKTDFALKSTYFIPGKYWALKEGSFTNNAGLRQEFSQCVFNNDKNISEIEFLNRLQEKLGVN